MGADSSPSVGKLFAALSKAQAEMGPAVKDRENPHFRSAYTTLASAINAARGALAAHGLAVVQGATYDGDKVTVTTTIACGDEWMRSHLSLRPTKGDPQGVGSAITYARRYAYMALLGLAPEDDDGEAASRGREPARSAPTQTRPPAASPADDSPEVEAIWAELKEVENLDDLRALRVRMQRLPEHVRAQYKDAYFAREAELSQ